MRVVRKHQQQPSPTTAAITNPSLSSPLNLTMSHSGGGAAPSPSAVSFASPYSFGLGRSANRSHYSTTTPGLDDDHRPHLQSTTNTAAPPPPVELPISAMDVEVFERFIMRVLTSLHRLVAKMHSEIAEGHALHNNGGGGGQGGHGSSNTTVYSPGGLETTSAAYAWTLVRRVTKRIEKLSIMEPVLEQKRAFLLARTAELESRAAASVTAGQPGSNNNNNNNGQLSSSATAAAAAQILHFGGQDATHYQRVQSELLLVEALITKVHGSVEMFKEVETKMMAQLFRH